ncbi:MAG TPA: hypothetical protein VNH18_25630 [Bryobacteraceae bacterium]|nr:hypothetical protein [Bryobacteraceae bacterium]
MQTDSDLGDATDLHATAQDTLAQFPGDSVATRRLSHPGTNDPSPETYLNLLLAEYQAGRYDECIAAAQKALALRHDFAEGWNNIAAARNAQCKWDLGIAAASEAVRLSPTNQIAKNNLAWAISQKEKSASH